jgi:hypothetical protein
VTLKSKILFGSAVFILAVAAFWPIASCEVANIQLHEDLRDLAAQSGARIGLSAPSSDEDLRNTILREARQHGIELEPGEVTVQRTGTAEAPVIYLAADYKVRINLLLFSYALHFTASSAKQTTIGPLG